MERSALHRKLKLLGVVTTSRGGIRVAVAGQEDDENGSENEEPKRDEVLADDLN